MKRRTILKRVGAVGAASIGIASSSAGASRPGLGLDQTLDVSDVSGTVQLASLVDGDLEAQLSADFLAHLPEGVTAADVKITVSDDLDTLDVGTMEKEDPCYVCCENICWCPYCICFNCESTAQ